MQRIAYYISFSHVYLSSVDQRYPASSMWRRTPVTDIFTCFSLNVHGHNQSASKTFSMFHFLSHDPELHLAMLSNDELTRKSEIAKKIQALTHSKKSDQKILNAIINDPYFNASLFYLTLFLRMRATSTHTPAT